MNNFIKLLYALLIAVSVVVFVGVAIFSFYAPPKAPTYPSYTYDSNGQVTKETNLAQKKYDADWKQHQKVEDAYQRNVTYIVLPVAALVTAGGLYLMRKPGVLGEGLALGGIATAAYGAITASIADSNPLRFVAVTLILAGVLLVSHARFGAEPKHQS